MRLGAAHEGGTRFLRFCSSQLPGYNTARLSGPLRASSGWSWGRGGPWARACIVFSVGRKSKEGLAGWGLMNKNFRRLWGTVSSHLVPHPGVIKMTVQWPRVCKPTRDVVGIVWCGLKQLLKKGKCLASCPGPQTGSSSYKTCVTQRLNQVNFIIFPSLTSDLGHNEFLFVNSWARIYRAQSYKQRFVVFPWMR